MIDSKYIVRSPKENIYDGVGVKIKIFQKD